MLSTYISHLTYRPAYAPFTPSNSGQRSLPTYYRGCWHVVSRSFLLRYRHFSSLKTEVYNPKTFFPHAASLHQSFLHCAIFPTAASRRSLGRVSVPMWPFILSDRLLIVALVGLYPHQLANQTQAHLQAEAFSEASFSKCLMRYSYIHSVLAPLSKCCPHLEGRLLTRYSPVRHLVFTEINTPFDLHVLSTPPAFVLSQDQTLQKNYFSKNRLAL